ncbi:MAG TPA: hypothetical protein DCP63_03105 [Bacteroidetes bacterium]|nr:hypothetical protein [Bacteroidota bacterium]
MDIEFDYRQIPFQSQQELTLKYRDRE